MNERREPLARRIAVNSASLTAARAVGLAVSFAFGIYVVRVLGVAEFGRYSVVMFSYTILTIFVNLGLEALVVREVARARDATPSLLRVVLRLKLGSSLVCLAILVVAAMFTNGRGISVPLVLVGVALVLDAIGDTASLMFQGHERFREPAIIGLLGGVLFALLGTGALIAGGGTTLLIAALVAAKVVQAAAAWSWMRSSLDLRDRGVAGATMRVLLLAAIPFFFAKLFYLVYFRIDGLMLDAIVGEYEVGLYAAAYKFVNVSTAVAAAFTAAMFPVMAAVARADVRRLASLFSGSIRYLLAAGLFVAVVCRAFSYDLCTFLFGSEYAGAVPALDILAGAIVFVFVNLMLSNMLLSLDREWLAVPVGGAAVSVNIALNAYLIPKYGAPGAAAATLVAEALVTTIYLAVLPRDLRRSAVSATWRVVPASIALSCILAWAPFGAVPRLLIGSTVFVLALGGLGGLNRADWVRFRSITGFRGSRG